MKIASCVCVHVCACVKFLWNVCRCKLFEVCVCSLRYAAVIFWLIFSFSDSSTPGYTHAHKRTHPSEPIYVSCCHLDYVTKFLSAIKSSYTVPVSAQLSIQADFNLLRIQRFEPEWGHWSPELWSTYCRCCLRSAQVRKKRTARKTRNLRMTSSWFISRKPSTALHRSLTSFINQVHEF